MNVSLTPTLEEFVHQKVASGLYNSASEVVRDGLRLLEEREKINEMKREELRRDIQKGFDSLDRGEGIPLDTVFEELERKYNLK
ncbi:MAG: hypothetical protein ACD_79C00988G0008 [uncultured bacterium]|nr:MAG: hypothetical protein ACD_79C00988G0008 [uncultured bacterium]